MSWAHIIKHYNKYAQAAATDAIDKHADPHVQLEQAITSLQEHHAQLQNAAARVIAQEKTAKMRLQNDIDEEAKLTASAQAALSQGNKDAARSFATKLAGIQDRIRSEQAAMPQMEADANAAREAVTESAEQLQAKMAERSGIEAQIDNAKMQEEVNASLKAVTDLTDTSDVPSFDSIKAKVQQRYATAQASTELESASPEVQEMHVHHAEITSQADAILDQLQAGTLKPAALEAPKDTASAT